MKMRLTQDYRVPTKKGTVITVDDKTAATLKALGVAEVVVTAKKKGKVNTDDHNGESKA